MLVVGAHVDIEIQVANEGNFIERAMYYISKIYVASLGSGEDYIESAKCALISIIDFNLFASSEIHSEFAFLEKKRHDLLSDKMGIHFFEMKKLPKEIDLNDGMQVWLKILKVESEADLKELEQLREVEIVGKALDEYSRITADEKYQELERMRDRAQRDRANELATAVKRAEEKAKQEGEQIGEQRGEQRGRQEEKKAFAIALHNEGMPLEAIMRLARITEEEAKEFLELGNN